MVLDLSDRLKEIDGCFPIIGVIKNDHSPNVEIAEEADAKKIESVIFSCNGRLDVNLIFSLREFIERRRINILHCHGYKSNFYGLLASRKNILLVATNHNWLKYNWKLKLYSLIDALLIRYFDKIVAVSERTKEEMLKYRISDQDIIIIDNGIGLGRFENVFSSKKSMMEFGFNDSQIIVGTIGTLNAEKGHIYLLRAIKEVVDQIKNVRFLIIGDGPMRKHLENNVISLDIQEYVVFTGYRRDVPELLSGMDIFILPSLKEGLPMVLLEAMAAGKPVIATKVGAIPKVITENENGILIEPEDVNSLYRAMIDLIYDSNKRDYLSRSGYERVRSNFASEKMCRDYLYLYNELNHR